MAPRKKLKRKKKRQPTPQSESEKQSSWTAKLSNGRFLTILFLIGLGVLVVWFLIDFHQIAPISRGTMVPEPHLKTLLYPICLGLIACCAYFCIQYFGSPRKSSPRDHWIFAAAFLLGSVIYGMSFTEDLLPNGDNGEYLILAQSLVEKGGAYRLDHPREIPNSLASLGLPLVLAPVYALWGFDFVKMKLLVMVMGLAIFPLLFMLFRKYHGYNLSAILAIVCWTSPYLVSSSTAIMTETPYLFWSVLALWLMASYLEGPTDNWKLLIVSVLALVMAYLTRVTGISALAALIIYLFLHIPWLIFFRDRNWSSLWNHTHTRRFVLIAGPLIIFGVAWQIYQAVIGTSQFYLFFNRDLPSYFHSNLNSAIWVLPQILFSKETYRWINFIQGSTLESINFTWMLLLSFMIFGLVTGLIKRHLLAIYTAMVLIIVLLGSMTAAEMVIIRYVTIIVPFLIYYFFIGVLRGLNALFQLFDQPAMSPISKVIGLLLLIQVICTGFHGDRLNIESSAIGYGPEYYDFIDVAKWSKNNLPDDAYILSIKPRIFYVYSEKKSGRLTNTSEVYTDEYILEKLQEFKDRGATHLVLDRISGSTRRNIFPLVEEHPDLFQTMYLGQIASTSAVLKIK